MNEQAEGRDKKENGHTESWNNLQQRKKMNVYISITERIGTCMNADNS